MNEAAFIRESLAEIQRSLGRIEGDVGALKIGAAERDKAHDDLRSKVSKIGNHQRFYAGGVAVIAFVAAKLGLPIPLKP